LQPVLQDVMTLSYRTKEKRQLQFDSSHSHAVLLSAQHFGGYNKRYQHDSTVLECPMKVRRQEHASQYSLVSFAGLHVLMTMFEQHTDCAPPCFCPCFLIADARITQFYVYWPPAAEEHKVPVRKPLFFNALHSLLAELMQHRCHNDSKEYLTRVPQVLYFLSGLTCTGLQPGHTSACRRTIDGLQHALCATTASKSLGARVTF
jgi:hypothetical protein